MPKTKVEVYDKDQLIYPYIESDHVTFSNGMKVSEMLDQSVSMSTVTHEDLNFKVGIGDQDVSSAIVDSSVAKMTIKGKTYQNILPEPSTHVLTNNKEMFKVNEGLDPNVEIVDGVSKSAILSGQTKLVDELGNECGHPNRPNAVIGAYINASTGEETLSDASCRTTYIKAPHETFKIRGKNRWKKLAFYDVSKQLIKTLDPALNNYNDYVVDGTLIPSNAEYMRVSGSLSPINSSDVLEPVLEILDVNNSSLYITQLQSCKMPVLTTVGKNLFDLSNASNGFLSTNEPYVLQSPDHNNKTSDYIRVKPNTKYSYSFDGFTPSQVGNMYWTGFYCYKRIGEVSAVHPSRMTFTSNSEANKKITFTTPSDCNYIRIGSRGLMLSGATAQLEEATSATPYEPYKSNILHAPEEVVLRSLPSGVCDTLNLNTGEYIQRIGEVVLDGSSDENWNNISNADNVETLTQFNIGTAIFNGALPKTVSDESVVKNAFIQNMFAVQRASVWTYREGEACAIHMPNPTHDSQAIQAKVLRSRLSSQDVAGWRALLQATPWILQYELATPVIKTVDLSSSGNWEKVVYSGASNENWSYRQEYDTTNTYCFKNNRTLTNALLVNQACPSFSDNLPINGLNVDKHSLHINGQPNVIMKIDKKLINEPTDINLRQYLQQNPVTVWYQTTTHQSSTQVKQPIFFKDGHIQLSSGVDHSLIPTLDYQAKTSNSYVMDLMKTNTRYTMKAKSASGTFTIDGTSYGAGTNGTFTTPSSMTNKLLVMSNKTNTEVMILEGDLTSKTIPYFKGIKSAFEGEDKIEVLSTGKNLADVTTVYTNMNSGYNDRHWTIVQKDENGFIAKVKNYSNTGTHRGFPASLKVYVEPNTTYYLSYDTKDNGVAINSHVYVYSNCETWGGSLIKQHGEAQKGFTFTTHSDTEYIVIGLGYTLLENNKEVEVSNLILSRSKTTYEPYKSNNTKIPLLSPLRSLPNGVCDELIIDRLNHKAKLIQRIGYVKFDNMDKLGFSDDGGGQYLYLATDRHIYFANRMELFNAPAIFSHFAYYTDGSLGKKDRGDYAAASNPVFCWCMPTKRDKKERESHLRNLAKQDGVIVQYQLATPVITEVDLEGFPYVYKDGHIFLNSEIVPTTEIIYSVNQCQQISASNEDIIRHEKELTYLQKLIAQYVQVDYESVLLSLKV